jgi:hypothetical protein
MILNRSYLGNNKKRKAVKTLAIIQQKFSLLMKILKQKIKQLSMKHK